MPNARSSLPSSSPNASILRCRPTDEPSALREPHMRVPQRGVLRCSLGAEHGAVLQENVVDALQQVGGGVARQEAGRGAERLRIGGHDFSGRLPHLVALDVAVEERAHRGEQRRERRLRLAKCNKVPKGDLRERPGAVVVRSRPRHHRIDCLIQQRGVTRPSLDR